MCTQFNIYYISVVQSQAMSIVRTQSIYLNTIYWWKFLLCKYDKKSDEIVHCKYISVVPTFLLMQFMSYAQTTFEANYVELSILSDQSHLFMLIISIEMGYGKLTILLFQVIAILKRNSHVGLMKRLHDLKRDTPKVFQIDKRKIQNLKKTTIYSFICSILYNIILLIVYLILPIKYSNWVKLVLVCYLTIQEMIKNFIILFIINIFIYLHLYLESIKYQLVNNSDAQGLLSLCLFKQREIYKYMQDFNKSFGYIWTILIADTFLIVTAETYYIYHLTVVNQMIFNYDLIAFKVFSSLLGITPKLLLIIIFIYVCDITSSEASAQYCIIEIKYF